MNKTIQIYLAIIKDRLEETEQEIIQENTTFRSKIKTGFLSRKDIEIGLFYKIQIQHPHPLSFTPPFSLKS